MKKTMVVLLCLGSVFFLIGFYIATTAVDNVFIGLFVMGIGLILDLCATIPAARVAQQQNKQREERIKKLEEEVEELKQNRN